MHQRVLVAAAAALASLAFAVPALAFDCTVARKPPLAGAVAVIDVTTEPEQITFLKPNPGTEEHLHGGFVAFTANGVTASTFVHAPDGVLPPVREGGPQDDCDGKGLDSIEVCFTPGG